MAEEIEASIIATGVQEGDNMQVMQPPQDLEDDLEKPQLSDSVSVSVKDESVTSQLDDSSLESDEEDGQQEGKLKFQTKRVQYAIVAMGMLSGFIMCFVTIDDNPHINQTLAIAIWMATLWLTEIIPLVVTAFFPLVLFPLFGILNSKVVATQYINNTIVLLMSGFLVALTLERWNLHKRLSLKILTLCGSSSPSLLLLGMMIPTFFLSMFISNTATTLMMVPNAMSIVSALEDKEKDDNEEEEETKDSKKKKGGKFATALLLGIAYAANVGGMSSLIGTPPNLVFQRQFELFFPDAPGFTFANWIAFGMPTGLIMFVCIWAYLCAVYLRGMTNNKNNSSSSEGSEKKLFMDMYAALGAWSHEQISVAVLFVLLCMLWVFRKDLNFGNFEIPGWSNIFPEPSYISDGTTGMLICILLFVLPGRSSMLGENSNSSAEDDVEEIDETTAFFQEKKDKCDTTLLDWKTANQMPYDVIFLLGGGFALAKAFVESGLSQYLGDQLANLDLSLAALLFLTITLIVWLTELTSNTSTSNIFVPLAASLAVATQVSPYTFMIPATMACSCAFVLPIATPPNSVVFSTGLLPMREMNKAGIILNVLGSLVLFAAAYTIIPVTLGVDANDYPTWAETNTIESSA